MWLVGARLGCISIHGAVCGIQGGVDDYFDNSGEIKKYKSLLGLSDVANIKILTTGVGGANPLVQINCRQYRVTVALAFSTFGTTEETLGCVAQPFDLFQVVFEFGARLCLVLGFL